MRQIHFTPRAAKDLRLIWRFIARDSVDAADRVFDRIHDAVRLLADHPGAGHLRDDIGDNRYRVWSIYSYLIVYRFDERELMVVRILHGARDLKRALRSPSS